MEKLLLYFCLFSLIVVMLEGHTHHFNKKDGGQRKLFVFGDSYVDNGNTPMYFTDAWREPYGITFPGKPSGRFSDGHVFSDYIASFLGIESPMPYRSWTAGENSVQNGMNFAHGGSGVFNTIFLQPKMSEQIQFFQQVLSQQVYNQQDLDSSVALVSCAGNDYASYLAGSGPITGFPALTTAIVNALGMNLKSIQGLGIKKIWVNALQPLGCLPGSTAISAYQLCNENINMAAKFHNQLLQQTVQNLNNGLQEPAFFIIDLYNAFLSILQGGNQGGPKLPLKPCCLGACGTVDLTGKKYILCEDRNMSFFWDIVHPTQQGWLTVYSALQSSLPKIS